MAEKKRFANIELLRCVAMVMVVVMHFMRESGSLLTSGTQTLAVRNIIATLLESFCIVAVNTYVLISGYYGANSSFKPAKILAFWCRVLFYALLIPVVLFFCGVNIVANDMGIYGLVQYVLPISSEHYWFASSYLYLLLFIPLLNKALKEMTAKLSASVIIGLLILFCGVKSIVPIPLALDRYGYDLSWFICVYLVGLWLGLYGGKVADWFRRHGGKVYLISGLGIFAMTLGLWGMISKAEGFAYYFTVPFHYNFVLCLTGAIGLFYVFSKINLKEGKMAELFRCLGKYAFGVYLLHEHIDIRHLWYPALTNSIKTLFGDGMAMFFPELLFCVIIIFVSGIFIDFLREKLFVFLVNIFAKKEG